MAKHSISKTAHNRPIALRPNEGAVTLDVRVQTQVGLDGKSEARFGFDLSKAPVPNRRYTAEVCDVTYVGQRVALMFAQPKSTGRGLRSALKVYVNEIAVKDFLRTVTEAEEPSVAELAVDMGIKPEATTKLVDEAEQTVVLVANIALLAVSGLEACLDFYHASAFAMQSLKSTSQIGLEAVVRVDLTTSLLLGILNRVASLDDKFKFDFEVRSI